MRIVLQYPPVWPLDGIALEVSPLRARPRDLDKLALTTLLRDVPSTIYLGAPAYSTSARGWQLRVQQVKALDHETEVERRILATYIFVDWVGQAMLLARDLAAFATHEAALRAMLESGEPDFNAGRAPSLWHALSHRPQ
ncbi:MAG: hypothetical protein ACKV2T_34255 [Kofleriaceae bacterium]